MDETQGHHRRSSLRSADPSHHTEHSVFVKPDVMITGGHRNDLVEMFAFYPELEFAGRVTGIFAALEHGDDHDFNWDRSRRSGLGDKRTGTQSHDQQCGN